MNEPQTPPPPPPQPALGMPQKKKFSPLAWVLIGCFALLLVGALMFVTCTAFVAKKAKSFVEEASENPAMATAEMIVRVNPELEMVSKNEAEQTITVRNTRTGEEVTLDLEDISEGRFSFESDGKQVQIDASKAAEGGAITVTDESGDEQLTIGGGSADQVPDWVPDYPGAEESTPFLMTSGDGVQGSVSLETDDAVQAVSDFYVAQLEQQGFEVEQATYSSGEVVSVMLSATADDGRTAYVSLTREGAGPTRVGINFSDER